MGRHLARIFLPFFDYCRIAHDLDLALIFGKAHPPAEALLVKIAQAPLIIVMVRWTEHRSAQAITRHVRKISFDRLGFGDVDPVKVALRKTKRTPLEKLAIG